MTPNSFFSPPEQSDVAGLMADYRRFLTDRNGRLAADGFERREAEIAALDASEIRYGRTLDNARMCRLHADLAAAAEPTEVELLLLAMHDINAAEEYGVKVTSVARAHLYERDDPLLKLEKWLAYEEGFHSRLLKGSAVHFGVDLPVGWEPNLSHRIIFKILSSAPASVFHPVLLGAEVTGLFVLNWLLQRIDRLDLQPDLKYLLQERIFEVMVDEVGHVTFNRAAIGPTGMKVARALSGLVIQGLADQNAPLVALGLDRETQKQVTSFDYADLPAEVRNAGFWA